MTARERIAGWFIAQWAPGPRGGYALRNSQEPDEELAQAIEAFWQRKRAESETPDFSAKLTESRFRDYWRR